MPLRKTLADLAQEARERGRVAEIDPDELSDLAEDGSTVVDVREPDERARGHIPGSVAIPRGVLERDIEKRLFGGSVSDEQLETPIVLYCGGGHRSLLAGDRLADMGFTRVMSLAGGFGAYGQSGQPVEVESTGRP